MKIFGIGSEPKKKKYDQEEAGYRRADARLRKLEEKREAVREELSRALRQIIKEHPRHG